MPIALKSATESLVGLLMAASLLALAGLAALTAPARAAEPIAFTIPAEDGYGIGDCLQAGSACGQAIANSWCEAHGHAKALAFGAADITDSTPVHAGPATEPAAVSIRCSD